MATIHATPPWTTPFFNSKSSGRFNPGTQTTAAPNALVNGNFVPCPPPVSGWPNPYIEAMRLWAK